MPIDYGNILSVPLQKQETNQTFGNMLSNAFEGYQGGQQFKEEQKKRVLSNEEQALANAIKKEYGAELERAKIEYLKNQGLSEGVRPDLMRSQIALNEAQASAGGKRYAPTGLAKLFQDEQDVKAGFLPGSNRMQTITPEEQEEYGNRIQLQMQKQTTDASTRKGALAAKNLVQSIDSANVDDLTRYSGPAGKAKFLLEQSKDLSGNPSEEYIRHREAQKAVALEVQELRQLLGASVSSEMKKALDDLVNSSSISVSPQTAKRMIEKSRSIIKKQMQTFTSGLKSTKPYTSDLEEGPTPEKSAEIFKNALNSSKNAGPASELTQDQLYAIVGRE